MNDTLAVLECARDIWRRRLAGADKRIAAAQADKAKAALELDAIDDNIAQLRLHAAANLLETGASA